MEMNTLVIVIAIAVLLAMVVLVIARVMFCKRVNKIAQYIFNELGNVEKVDDAIFFLSEYEKAVKCFEREIRSEQKKHTEESNKIWLFRRKKKLDEYSKKIEDNRTSKDKYEIDNKKTYQNCLKILDYIGKDFYEKNKAKIAMKVKQLIQNASEKERLLNQRLQEKQEQTKRKMIENLQKERDVKNKRIEEQAKRDKVSKAIRELDDYMPVLQGHARDKKALDFQVLKFVEDKLVLIENGKVFINPNDLNNVERIRKKLTSIFNKFKNDEFVQMNINLIEESLDEILK
jgi:hypothetical protein